MKCLRNEREVKLLDGIYDKEIVKICEECAVFENLPIIRKPTSYQLEVSEKPYTVRERLARMAGVKLKEDKQPLVKFAWMQKQAMNGGETKEVSLENLRKPKDYSKIMPGKWETAKKRNQPLDLVDNYNWHIQMMRRKRKLTLGQVAEIVGEQEGILKLVEQGNLPDDANRIITKLEQYFKINLRKSEQEKEEERIKEAKKLPQEPIRILSFNKESLKNITIADLKKMKEEGKKEEKTNKNTDSGDIEFFDD